MKSITTKPNDVRCYDNVNQRHNVQDFITVKSNLEAVTELIDNQELPCPYTLRYSGAWDIRVINVTQETNPSLEFIEVIEDDDAKGYIKFKVTNNNEPVTGARVYYNLNNVNYPYLTTGDDGCVNIPAVDMDHDYEYGDNTLIVWAQNIPIQTDEGIVINHDSYYAQTITFKAIPRGFLVIDQTRNTFKISLISSYTHESVPNIKIKGTAETLSAQGHQLLDSVSVTGVLDEWGNLTLTLNPVQVQGMEEYGRFYNYKFEAITSDYSIPIRNINNTRISFSAAKQSAVKYLQEHYSKSWSQSDMDFTVWENTENIIVFRIIQSGGIGRFHFIEIDLTDGYATEL